MLDAAAMHAVIDALIATVQERFPGYHFRLASGIEARHNLSASVG